MNRTDGPLTQYFAKPSAAPRPVAAGGTLTIEVAPAAPDLRDYAALVARVKAAVGLPLSWRVYGQQVGTGGIERYDLLLVRIPARGSVGTRRPADGSRAPITPPARRHVLLNGGTHGEEPAGAEAMVRFLEERRYERWPSIAFTLIPCANPWGYVHDRREGPGGRDLNRSFRRAGHATPEVALLKRALGRRAFDLFVDCHEDEDAPGLYVFAPSRLGLAIVAAASALGPVHQGPLVDDIIPLAAGVVEIDSARALERRRTWRNWPLPFYIAQHHRRRTRAGFLGGHPAAPPAQALPIDRSAGADAEPAWAVVETATFLPLEQRVAMHLAAIDAAIAAAAG
jgi:hypothetical protein